MGKTRPASFRLSSDVLDQLQRESAKANLPLNAYVERAFRRYLNYVCIIDRMEMVYMMKGTITSLMGKLTDEEIVDSAGEAVERFVEAVTFANGKFDGGRALKLLMESFQYSTFASVEFFNEGDTLSLRLKHSVGPKWSLYMATLIKEVFKKAGVAADVKHSSGLIILCVPADLLETV